MRTAIKISVLLLILALLVSCVQGTPSATSVAPTDTPAREITIRVDDLVVRPIEKEFSYDYCSSAIPVEIVLTFGQVLSEKFYKELLLE